MFVEVDYVKLSIGIVCCLMVLEFYIIVIWFMVFNGLDIRVCIVFI